jgi:hypothetical protein
VTIPQGRPVDGIVHNFWIRRDHLLENGLDGRRLLFGLLLQLQRRYQWRCTVVCDCVVVVGQCLAQVLTALPTGVSLLFGLLNLGRHVGGQNGIGARNTLVHAILGWRCAITGHLLNQTQGYQNAQDVTNVPRGRR